MAKRNRFYTKRGLLEGEYIVVDGKTKDSVAFVLGRDLARATAFAANSLRSNQALAVVDTEDEADTLARFGLRVQRNLVRRSK